MSTEFKEIQKFSQWWLWVLLIGLGLVPIVGLYKQLYLNQAFGDKPMSTMALGILCLFTFSFIVLFWCMCLKTHINPHGVHMHFFPFIKKQVHWDQIKTIEVVNYGFVGGWGIRLFTSYGTVYNIQGNMGLAIELTSGKKFLIGTQKPKELTLFIEKLNTQTLNKT